MDRRRACGRAESPSCDIHIHTPSRKVLQTSSHTSFVIHICSTSCLGHWHGYDRHSIVTPKLGEPSHRARATCMGCQAGTTRIHGIRISWAMCMHCMHIMFTVTRITSYTWASRMRCYTTRHDMACNDNGSCSGMLVCLVMLCHVLCQPYGALRHAMSWYDMIWYGLPKCWNRNPSRSSSSGCFRSALAAHGLTHNNSKL